jgi:hypothetical protein
MRRPCRPAALVAGTQKRARKLGTRSGPPPGAVKTWLRGRCAAARCALQLMDEEGRQPDGPTAGARLGRTGDQLALDLGEDLGHGDRPGQLADPQAA